MPSTATEEVLEETPQGTEEPQESSETPIKRKPKVPKARLYRDKPGGEDFFEYINSVPQEERSLARLRFWAINQDGSIGGMVHQIVGGWTDLDESWMREQPQIGIGKFKVELRNPGKTGRANDYTIVQIGSDEEISKQRLIKQGLSKEGGAGAASELHGVTKGIDAFASATEKGLGFLEKSYEKALQRSQLATDPAAMLSALSNLIPKQDNNYLVTILENQRKDAEARAEREAREAAERHARELKEAGERAARDQQFFSMMMGESEKRATERAQMMEAQINMQSKFFEAMMAKEKERADSLGQFTGLIKGFLEVREKIEDSFSGGQPKGWEGVISTAIDKAGDVLPHIMSRFGGGSPPQQPQMMPAPGHIGAQEHEQQEFPEMVNRIGKYLSRDVTLWDGSYIVRLIETEYPVTHAQLMNQPKEAILQAFKSLPIGDAILAHEAAAKLLNDVIDVIKNPDLFDTVFPEEPEPEEPQEPPPGPQRRKANGRIHREKVGEPV